jgi:hypothetical protein
MIGLFCCYELTCLMANTRNCMMALVLSSQDSRLICDFCNRQQLWKIFRYLRMPLEAIFKYWLAHMHMSYSEIFWGQLTCVFPLFWRNIYTIRKYEMAQSIQVHIEGCINIMWLPLWFQEVLGILQFNCFQSNLCIYVVIWDFDWSIPLYWP